MTAQEFSQRPFAAGTLQGLRSFRVTDLGTLTGVVHKGLWNTGVNVAECLAPSVINFLGGKPSRTHGPDSPDHELASLGCTCGWHAYFDGSNDYMTNRWILNGQFGVAGVIDGWGKCVFGVAGVIEGWGKCVYGTRGFRCEKAVIKALVVPQGHTEWPVGLLQKVRDRYPVPWFDTSDAAVVEFPLTPKEASA